MSMALSVPDSVKQLPEFGFPRSKAIQRAIASGSTKILRYLLRQGCDVNVPCGRQRLTSLMLACYMTDADKRSVVMDMLLSSGADPSLTDRKGWNALFYACALGVVDVAVRLLDSANIDLSAVDVEGNTALHIAAMEGSPSIVSKLLEEMAKFGTSINVRNSCGCTPLTTAIYNGHTECAALLHTAGGFPKLYEGDFARVMAMSFSQPEFAKELLLSMMPAGSILPGLPGQGKRPTLVTGARPVKPTRTVTAPDLWVSYSDGNRACTTAQLPIANQSRRGSLPLNRYPSTRKTVTFQKMLSHPSAVPKNRPRLSVTQPPSTIVYQRTESLENSVLKKTYFTAREPPPAIVYLGLLLDQNSMLRSRPSIAHRRSATYPCNDIISTLLTKVGPPQHTSSYPSGVKAMQPISHEWIETVKECRVTISPPQPTPQLTPLPTTPQPTSQLTPQPTPQSTPLPFRTSSSLAARSLSEEKVVAESPEEAAVSLVETTPLVSATPLPEPKPDVEDLFSAHDFDIQIDLPSSSQGQSEVKIAPKATPPQKSDGPRRSLNLSDYKKRRGLI